MSEIPAEVTESLVEYSGAAVQIWSYSVSHARLELRLTLKRGSNLHLIMTSCRRIESETAFGHSRLRVTRRDDGIIVVSDDDNRFKVECRGVGTARDVAPVY